MPVNEKTPGTTRRRVLHANGRAATAAMGAVAAALVLAACGSGTSGTTAGSGTSPATSPATTTSASPTTGSSPSGSMSGMATITIKDFKYSGPASVPAGSMVIVTNDDSVAHTLTADQGSAFSVTVAPGKTSSFTAPSKPGSYPYHCTYHANMHGTLKVS